MAMNKARFIATVVLVGGMCIATSAFGQYGVGFTRPDSVVDLRTDAGAALVNGQWKYADAKIIEVDHRNPGPDLKPSGSPNRTHDIEPKAGIAGFDDSTWDRIAASSLEQRRSTGRLAFG